MFKNEKEIINSFDVEDFYNFSVSFKTDRTNGRVFIDVYDRIIVCVNEFEFILCEKDEFNEYVLIPRLEKGFKIYVDGVGANITHIYTETYEENIKLWEELEARDF